MEHMEQCKFRINQVYSLYQLYSILLGHRDSSPQIPSFQFAIDNFFVMLISQLHSLFDPSGFNLLIEKDSDLNDIKKKWKKIEKPVTKTRNNLGFHGPRNQKSLTCATTAFAGLDGEGIEIAMSLFVDLKKFEIKKHRNVCCD